ncbi:hypothetical protein Xmau_02672 [Xenorhabdus mauleonii]|uniref:Uncharacterized protein n=1 Tax=Xenorhabdus mauleonii TaxID=351675 RepID=A0A1I3UID2_9GAMM|nr:hypothetical protein [Xenorhabdus mauleonii]PHM39663.1 hypothetical protein Xmau_02672 [Xenorhabdus mauleonii]SFJ83268.1 hypothetical protein SAMN05421680_11745 [Xenorhabdus mauleonii]
MKNISVFYRFYVFEDSYHGYPRLTVCAHGSYDKIYFIGYISGVNMYDDQLTPRELDNELKSKGIMLNSFRYIRLIVCESANCEKDNPDTTLEYEESFASELSKLCPNSIVIGYVGNIRGRTKVFNKKNLSYSENYDNTQRHELIFDLRHIYDIHFSRLVGNKKANDAFEAEKKTYSKIETVDPITPRYFLRTKRPGRPVNNDDPDFEQYTARWFKNGKLIHTEMLVL